MSILKSWKWIVLLGLSQFQFSRTYAQLGASNSNPLSMSKDDRYEIVDISLTGTKFLDPQLLQLASGLQVGDKIYLENDGSISRAIKKLWDQKLLEDVRIDVVRTEGKRAWLNIAVVERPKLGVVNIKGVRSTQQTELKTKLKISENRMITDALKIDMSEKIKKYFAEKGYANAKVTLVETNDPNKASFVNLDIIIDKGKKVLVEQVNIVGNDNVSTLKLKRSMKGTKEKARLSFKAIDDETIYEKDEERSFGKYLKNMDFLSLSKTLEALNPYFRYNFFSNAKYDPVKFQEDKESLINVYNNLGYRDAQIESDTVYSLNGKDMRVDLKINEGNRYYFGDIEYRGNTLYSDSILNLIVDIKKGDVYNRSALESKLGLQMSADGSGDISSLYLDNGYLFFTVNSQEKSITNDTINYLITIQEGPIATVKNVQIYGNQKTNDHVLRRELYTLPGSKFSRADVIRSVRQLSTLGFINPEKVSPEPRPNPSDYTVDIDYNIEEKSSDQLEVSAGYSGAIGFTGSIGLVFNNFSVRNITKPKTWQPLPMGDGQKLSIRWQSSGLWYNSGNFSFTEPWLGGKKPHSMTISGVWTRIARGNAYANGSSPKDSYIRNIGGGVSFGRRLNWPDDYFVFSYGLNYQNYFLKDYQLFSAAGFSNGSANNIFAKLTLARNSLDQPLYPRSGSNISLSVQFTPPYSLFSDKDYENITTKDRYKWVEYHKYRFNADWYQRIAGDLILKVSAKLGFVGNYNKKLGFSPFERFQLGGDGLSGNTFMVGKDIISQRGYDVYLNDSATIFNKYSVELRYPFSLNPSATIYGLIFADGANVWNSMKDYNPLQLNRSVGAGVRIFLPMFGLLGLDYGIGLDRYVPGASLSSYAKFTFMLGFEPD